MQNIREIQLIDGSHEEVLPGFSSDFPYIATCAELNKYADSLVPWHWHRAVELFYIQSGTLEYHTPGGKWSFPAGSGGMVNSNILHSTSFQKTMNDNVQLLHLFDPVFLAGEHGSRLETKYILPLTASSDAEIIPLYPEVPAQADILAGIKSAFDLSEQEWGYELKLREKLAHIWLGLHALVRPSMTPVSSDKTSDDKIKTMMIYIHEHYREPISVLQLMQAAHISKRACFRLFQKNLHMTPMAYIRSYRLQKACQMLIKTTESITRIAYDCGFGSSSNLGKLFHSKYHCSPRDYRNRWHNSDKNRHP